jgi:hypothetical protein
MEEMNTTVNTQATFYQDGIKDDKYVKHKESLETLELKGLDTLTLLETKQMYVDYEYVNNCLRSKMNSEDVPLHLSFLYI